MKNIIKQTLDEFISYSKQVNLDSEAARDSLAQFIYEEIKKCQNQKDQENIKTKKG
jgi:hypothetical protein